VILTSIGGFVRIRRDGKINDFQANQISSLISLVVGDQGVY
jgi:hypothetical protein